jgi:hypothetical protein
MSTAIDLHVQVVPWDDPDFVRAFEAARNQVRAEGLTINGPKACARAEALIRLAGFPDVRIDCDRTPAEAMAHIAHWTVIRDGRESSAENR